MFKNVRLHCILPQLRTFKLSLRMEPNAMMCPMTEKTLIWLPEMTGCKDLREISILGGGLYQITGDPVTYRPDPNQVPFPRGLRKLTCYGTILNWTRNTLRECMKDWDCELNFN